MLATYCFGFCIAIAWFVIVCRKFTRNIVIFGSLLFVGGFLFCLRAACAGGYFPPRHHLIASRPIYGCIRVTLSVATANIFLVYFSSNLHPKHDCTCKDHVPYTSCSSHVRVPYDTMIPCGRGGF